MVSVSIHVIKFLRCNGNSNIASVHELRIRRDMKNLFLLICLLLFVLETNPIFWRRRRRRRAAPVCSATNCQVGSWTGWGSCSRQCGTSGEKERTRPVVQREACGGSCPYNLRETEACNRGNCRNLGTPQYYGCSCRSGYTGTCCESDVYECTTTRPCQHNCYNTYGSYTCTCYSCYTKVGTRCDLRQCKISNRCYTYGDVNPSNPCQDCSSSSQTSWRNNNALQCSDGVACTRNDRCSSGTCIGTPFTCLSCEECYNDACRIKPGFCVIPYQGVRTCFVHATLRPGYPCQQCDSNSNTQWTNNNNLQCSDDNMKTRDDRCTGGACVGNTYPCLSCETHDGSGCPIKSGFCVVQYQGQRTCFAKNQYKPGNPCQYCNPDNSTSTWSNRDGVACDDNDNCTRGDTCRSGQCTATPFTCNSLCQYCNGTSCSLKTGFGFDSSTCLCKIAENSYSHQALNPSNQCQWCDLNDAGARTISAWTNRPTVTCDDENNCTKQDICNAGRCEGQDYSCQTSYPSISCIKTSQCIGDGTCRHTMRLSGTICRPAVDICDQPERCDGSLGTCPGAVTDTITLTTGTVQFTDQTFQTSVAYQYFTDKLHLKISGFSVSCGQMSLRWFVLSGASACSVASSVNGTFPDSNTEQSLTGLTLHNDDSYKVSIKAVDMRDNIPQLVCSGVITIDTSKPQGGWIRDGPGADLSYQASKMLQVNWGGVQSTHGVGKYEWKVLLTSFQSNQTTKLMPFTNVNLSTNANKMFNSVTDGSKVEFVVRAYTKAGLYRDLTSDGVVIDTSPPVASKIYDGNQAGVDEMFSKRTNTFSANWGRFTDPHSPVSRYSWAVKRTGAGSLITSFMNTALNRSTTANGLNLVSGESYCAVVRGYNEAGLYTQATSDCVLIDYDAPRPGTVNDGYTTDIDYQSENTTIAANWNGFTDGTNGSGIVEYRYKITDVNGSTIIAWTTAGNATNITNDGLDLKDTKYFVTVKAVDAVGLSTDVTSDGVIVDKTHPVFTGKVIVTGENDAKNGTPCVYVPSTSSVTVQWVGFHDAHSGLQRYDWAIVPSDSLPSSSDFRVVPGPNLPTTATFTGLALTQGKSYHVIIRAFNKAKLYKDALSDLVIPDSTPPSPGKVYDGPTPGVDIDYQVNLNYVYATWTRFSEPHTSVKQYYYAVGSCTMGNYHVTGNAFVQLNPVTATSFIVGNITLVNGQRYCVKVKAENKAGLLSSEVSSDGFVADVTPPSVRKAQVRDGNTGSDIDYQANTTKMSAEWDGITDPESGIKYYEYGISRNRAGTPDVFPFQNGGLNTSATVHGLSLIDDVYYFIVCAVNNAGLRKCISSDGVLIDLSPPNHGVVYDGIIEPDLKYQSSLTSMAANWEGIWDLESGIEKFEWSIGSSKQNKANVQDYTNVGLSTHVKSQGALNLVSGTQYHVHLKVTNTAGAVKELVSDGVVADGTPPLPSKIYPGYRSSSEWQYNHDEKAFYSASSSSIAVYWNRFSEPESEVWYYKWAIGTSACGSQIQPFINIGRTNHANTTMTDLVFRSRVKYYVTVTSRNRAGLGSQSCSEALVFDSTPPTPGNVVLEQPETTTKKRIFVSNTSVSISWSESSDLESGINRCRFAVLDQGGNVVFVQTHNETAGKITLPKSVIFLHGASYNASVECSNNAGLSAASSSLVFTIDNTPPIQMGPIIAGVTSQQTFQYQSDTESITASWQPFVELESGLDSYYFAIGRRPYEDDVVAIQNVHLATRITKTGLSLSQGATYYITVTATNLAGLSTNASSLGLVIDTTPPVAANDSVKDGSSGDDRDYFSPDLELAAHWEGINDPESGIMSSQYCLGTRPLGCQIQPPTHIGANTTFACSECHVNPGERVYVTVHVTNGAGLSVARASDGMLLDISPPIIGQAIDGSEVTEMDYNIVLKDWNVSMSWFGVEDLESGVQTCVWTIETNDGVSLLRKDIGNSSKYGQRTILSEFQTYKDLQFINNITYYNVLTCWNKAGSQSTSQSNGFRVKSIWPIPAAVRDGPMESADVDFITSTKMVVANWDPFVADSTDPVIDYIWAVGTVAGKDDILRFTNIGLSTNAQVDLAPEAADLDVLRAGQRYYITVKATSSGGLSSMGISDGFIVDPSPPMIPEVSVTHEVTDQTEQSVEIRVSWDGVKDDESGIRSSDYCLETTPRTCIRGTIGTDTSTSGTIGHFKPESRAEYYVTVFVVNGAGLTSVRTSNKLTFDTSPPTQGEVIDGIGQDIDFTNSTESLSIQWGEFEDDESGVVACSWSLVEQSVSDNSSIFGNDSVVMTKDVANRGHLTQANLSLVPGARYVSQITCTNADGFSITSVSDGVVVDVTPPSSGLVHDGPSLLADVQYQSSTTLVQAVWRPFTDHESSIIGYRLGLGTSPDDDDVIKFTDIGMKTSFKSKNVTLISDKRYYVTVEAINGVGLTSHGWSDGFLVDVSPPELTETSRGSKLWLGPKEQLHAIWKSRDPESDISTTEFCVGTVSVGCQVKPMAALSHNATDVTCTDCHVNHRGTYYITVRVKNGAGLFTVATTDEVQVDLTPPYVSDVIPNVEVTSCVTNCTLVSNITAFEDKESGVKSCSFAVRNSSHFITGFENNGLDKTVEATDLQLVTGEKYYTVVRCENNVGLVTEVVSKTPVLVDNTPPTKGSVIVSADRTHDVFGIHSSCHLYNRTLRAHWFGFNDEESGVSGFRVAVGKQPNATDILSFQDVGVTTNVTLPLNNNTSLFEGNIVYVTVESHNPAGLTAQSSSPPTRLISADSDDYMKEGDFYCLNF